MAVLKLCFTEDQLNDIQEVVDYLNSKEEKRFESINQWISRTIVTAGARGAGMYRQYLKDGRIQLTTATGLVVTYDDLKFKEVDDRLEEDCGKTGKIIGIHIGHRTVELLKRAAMLQNAINKVRRGMIYRDLVSYAKRVILDSVDVLIEEVWIQTAQEENEEEESKARQLDKKSNRE